MRSYNGRLSVEERHIAEEMTVLRVRQKHLRERWLLIDIRLSELRERLRCSMAARGDSLEKHEEQQQRRLRTAKRRAASAQVERFKKLKRDTRKKSGGAT